MTEDSNKGVVTDIKPKKMYYRAATLLSDGGPSEVARGVKDFTRDNIWGPIKTRKYQFLRPVITLEIAGAEASFRVTSHKEEQRATSLVGEEEAAVKFLNNLTSDQIVWDIGASIGTYSLLAADIAKQAIAFEPVDVPRLAENVELNNANVQIESYALSDSDGFMKIQLGSAQAGDGSHTITQEANVSIPTYRGDTVGERLPAPDAIKIDVEGHEKQVLDGLKKLLPEVEQLLIEVHPEHGVETSDIRGQLESSEFSVEQVQTDRKHVHLWATNN